MIRRNLLMLFSGFLFFSCALLGIDDSKSSISIQSPTNGEIVSGIITVSGQSKEIRDMIIDFSAIDFSVPVVMDNNGRWSFEIDTRLYQNGDYSLTATGIDTQWKTVKDSVTFTVDNGITFPDSTIEITNPNADATVSGITIVSGSCSSDIDSIVLAIGSDILQSIEPSDGSWTFNWDTSAYADGSAAITASGYSGTELSASDSINVVVNNTPFSGSIEINAPTDGSIVAGPVTVSGTYGGDTDNISLSIGGGSPQSIVLDGGNWSYEWDSTSVADGTYSLAVYSYNGTTLLAADSISVEVDNIAPTGTVSISTPTNGSTLSGNFLLSGTYAGDIDSITFAVNGGSETTVPAVGGAWSYTWDTSSVSNGSAALTVRGYAGTSILDSQSISVFIDNGLLSGTLSIGAPSDSENVSGKVSCSGTYSGDIDNVTISINGGGETTVTSGGGSWSYLWDSTAVSDGIVSLTVRGYAGTDLLDTRMINVTVINSVVTILTPADSATVSGDVNCSGSYSGDIDSVTLSVNSGSETSVSTGGGSWSYLWDSTLVSDGFATLTIRGYSGADLRSTEMISVTVSNGALSGTVSIDSPSDTDIVSGNVVFSGTYTGDVDSVRIAIGIAVDDYAVLGGGTWTYTWDSSGETDDNYTVAVIGYSGTDMLAYESIGIVVSNNPDAYEPDDSAAAATVLSVGADQVHTLNHPSDADWYVFTATAGTSYIIETSQETDSTDTYLDIYDTDGLTLLDSDDDGGDGFFALLNWTCPVDGDYYFRVTEATGWTGDYRITLSTVAAVPADGYESDNLPADATPLVPGVPQTHTFHAIDDADWFSFSATSGTTYTITTSFSTINTNTFFAVIDTDGATPLYFPSTYLTDDYPDGSWTCPADGTYYIMAGEENSSNTGDYTIQLD